MVEVQLGQDAEWTEAELSEPLSDDSWVQWQVAWTPEPGRQILTVRATDGNGDTQTDQLAPPAPNGATGYHTIGINVSAA
jgi:hypothetical protein